jgi:hypothetical protein
MSRQSYSSSMPYGSESKAWDPSIPMWGIHSTDWQTSAHEIYGSAFEAMVHHLRKHETSP